MKPPANLASAPINLDHPGTYLHWSIFTVSVANLCLIAVMVVIFGLALVLPFPKGRTYPPAPEETAPAGPDAAATAGSDEDRDMWTSRARRFAVRLLPPGKLLPDRQPAYVASWVYVFGVASLAAFGVAVVSGFALALGGPDWWHYNSVGHFCNSLHLWSVELFMALLVIHLWGKFWMAAWRGKRAWTWITGVVAFLASVVECFTGYVSQQNFDAQWISASGKDAFNPVGVGAFFNIMNFGQMLMWHIVLIPIVLAAFIGAHVLLVRVRGVSHPLPPTVRLPGRGSYRQRRRALAAADAAPWRGPTRRYDILKEGTIAGAIILVLTVALASLLSSPDVPSVTIQSWAKVAPADFLATAATELNGTSGSATYGPPYNNGTGSVQKLLFSPAQLAGVRQPLHPAQDFVLQPLGSIAATTPAVARAVATYRAAPAAQQVKWANAYATAVTKVKFVGGTPVVPAAADGPVPVLLANELTMARSGALDASLISKEPFYGTNFTAPLLFMNDGAYFADKATAMHLSGEQWGVMNETGSYPGQPWLWLYTLWYQVPGWSSSANVDMIAVYMTGLATLLLLLVPFIPGVRDVPRLIPVHRLIWRGRKQRPGDGPPPPAGPARSIPQLPAHPERKPAMRSAVVRTFGQPLVIEDRPVPEPAPGQVVIRMEASGLCHTDIHAAHGDWPVRPAPPFVPGHEGVGIVHAAGDGVTSPVVGQRVAVPWLGYACGTCQHCLTGWETLCASQQNTGYSVDGGFAEYFTADAAFAAPVPDGIDPVDAAPLTCAGVTTYKAVKVGNVRPGDLVAISGIGGLGHLALQYAKIFGGIVAAIDITDEKLQLAKDLGADLVIDARTEDPAQVLQAHGGASVAVGLAVDSKSFATAYAGLRRGGRLVLVALPASGTLEIPVFDTVLNGTSVIGSIVGTRADLATVFALHGAGRTRVVADTRPLAAVNEAIGEILRGQARARIVLQP